MTDLAIPGMGYAYANYGRWVVDCPYPFCDNAMQVDCWQGRFECLGPDSCGYTCPVAWPNDPEAIETLLAMRPARKTRNWLPGESLEDLLKENAVHNVLPPDWLDESGCILETRNERVVAGRLLSALPEYRRREIGA